MDETTIQALIQELLEKLGITVESISPILVAGQQMFNVHTPDSKQLIGPHGDHLRALNYVVRKLAEQKFNTKKLGL